MYDMQTLHAGGIPMFRGTSLVYYHLPFYTYLFVVFFTVYPVILTLICVSSIQQYVWNNYTNTFCHGYMFLCYFVWFVFHHLIVFLYISMCSCVCLVCCIFHISYNLISCGRFPLLSSDFGPWWPSDLGPDIIVVSLMHRGFTVGFSSFASSLWWE